MKDIRVEYLDLVSSETMEVEAGVCKLIGSYRYNIEVRLGENI
jgi:hypothetical protein